MKTDTLSARQLTMLFAVSMAAALARAPYDTALFSAGPIGWAIPAPAFLISAPVLVWIGRLLKKGPLEHLAARCLGSVPSKILFALLALWALFHAAVTARFLAERMVTGIYPNANVLTFLAVFLILSAVISRGKLVSAGRMGAVIGVFLAAVILLIFLLAIPSVKLENLWPPAQSDLTGLAVNVPLMLSPLNILLIFLFLGGRVHDRENLSRESLRSSAVIYCLSALYGFFSIGMMSSGLARGLPLPILSGLRTISVSAMIQRPEIFTVALWMLPDILLTVMLVKAAIMLIGKTAHSDNPVSVSTPLHFLLFAGCLLLSGSVPALNRLAEAGARADCVILIAVPLILTIGCAVKRSKTE